LYALEAYKATPGDVGQTPPHFSDFESQSVARGRPRLLMFVHPLCPCSRASLAELAEIMARNPGKVDTEVIFVKPANAGASWDHSSLWKLASNIPDVRLVCDGGGSLARRLGALTSGYVLLYDAGGRLLFSGGITRSRGHEGDNPGRRALCALLAGGAASDVKTPVFGCSLFSAGECVQTSHTAPVNSNGHRP